jgi:hypothetical protein
MAKEGDTYKVIRFGQQGVSGSPKKEGESASYRARRESFKARHAKKYSQGAAFGKLVVESCQMDFHRCAACRFRAKLVIT